MKAVWIFMVIDQEHIIFGKLNVLVVFVMWTTFTVASLATGARNLIKKVAAILVPPDFVIAHRKLVVPMSFDRLEVVP